MAIATLIKPTALGWNIDCLTCNETVANIYSKEITEASDLDHIAEKHLATHEVV